MAFPFHLSEWADFRFLLEHKKVVITRETHFHEQWCSVGGKVFILL
jgi:hypothetical protein